MFFNMNVGLKKQWSSWKHSQELGPLAHPSCKAFPSYLKALTDYQVLLLLLTIPDILFF